MKQLKFMLAAATAIGLATAAQAATEELSSENFNDYGTDKEVVSIDGFSFNGAEGDNESAIVAESENDKALKVSTGTDPLLRMVDTKYRQNVNLADDDFNSLNIDTMVQFTVTPESDTVLPGLIDPNAKDEEGNIILENNIKEDKLLIYLQEKVQGETKVNVLTVWASAVQSGGDDDFGGGTDKFVPTKVEIPGVEVVPNQWYRLQVKTYVEDGIVLFSIKLGNTELASSVTLYSGATLGTKAFPSLLGKATTLTYVGFAGEGMVDDLVVTKDYDASSLDFTLDLGDNVSAVSWTVNGDKQDEYTFKAASGVTSFTVAIASVTYAPGYAGTKDWTGWTSNVTESTSISIEATKFADVSGDVVTPTTDTITAADGGAFACPASGAEDYAVAVEKLGKAVTWATSVAKKSYDDAMACINEMDFANVTTNNVEEAAYLFNCEPTPAAVAAEAAAFKFPSFTKDMTIDAMKAAVEADKNYNGTVEIHGATTLENGGNWANGQSGSFYKAVLTK